MTIPFNKPYLSGKELEYIRDSVQSGKISGNGKYTKRCHEFFETTHAFGKALMTTSCTDALEMAAILCDISSGDEVILPSYTFVSTANAFALRGAKLVLADSMNTHPNIDPLEIERLITPKTKAIVVVHYAGVACQMDEISALIQGKNILLIEDAAQGIASFYNKKRLGAIGDFGCFSFHETKNINSGEGGLLTVNNPSYVERAEYIWEKGTNRSAFFRGEVNKYDWIDIGSSFLPSDIISAYLFAQLENIELIQKRRIEIWNHYHAMLKDLAQEGYFELPYLPDYATNNAHMFYLVMRSPDERESLLQFLQDKGVWAVFHYLGLHSSPYYLHSQHSQKKQSLPNTEKFASQLIRLPLFYELTDQQLNFICEQIRLFIKS